MTDYSPPNTFYTQIYGLFENEDMYRFIGKNGAHFKSLTEYLKVDYIWWNKDSNIIEIWGPHNRLTHCKNKIQGKMEKFIQNKQPTQKMFTNEDYANMDKNM